jgi:hypothetical protein
MRTTLRQTNLTTVEVWRGTTLTATLYLTPGGLTLHCAQLTPEDVDLDGQTLHVELRRP